MALKLVVDESGSAQARELWRKWARDGLRPIAPALFLFECVSALRRMIVRGDLEESAAQNARDRLLAMPIYFPAPVGLVQRTWDLAARYDRPQAYDCFYLALAQLLGADLWTADERFFNAVRKTEQAVYLVKR